MTVNAADTMSRKHRCPGPGRGGGGCTTQVRPEYLMCGYCWRLVPKPLQRRVYATWNGGQGAGTDGHTAAMLAAIEAANGRG